MDTIRNRLLEVMADQGKHTPSNRDFEAMLDLSSGRITQLFQAGSAAKLGAESLLRLVALGYNPAWIMYGAPNSKKLCVKEGEMMAAPDLRPDEREVIAALRRLRDTRRNLHIAQILDEAAGASPYPPPEKKARRSI
jgi:hypothetical protein